MEESKAKIETQLKLLDLAERETQKVIARNRTSEIERHLNHFKLRSRRSWKLRRRAMR